MAIAKRPKPTEASATEMMDEQERDLREQEFLASAPDVASRGQVEKKPKRQKMQTVHLRFEPDLLPRIEAAAKESGHDDRSAWIRYVVKQALKDLETTK